MADRFANNRAYSEVHATERTGHVFVQRFRGPIRAMGLVAIAILPIAAVHAQTVTQGPSNAHDSAKADDLPEVVITAERRSSTVQKTAFSITALTGEQLMDHGLSSIKDVAAEVPGLSMRSAGPGQTEYEMRGLPSSGGSSATVGLYLNDVPLSAPAASLNGKVTVDPDLFDLSRVEVLRGPQGTLYGSGSMGGTIRLITNQPNLAAFESSVQATPSFTENGGFNLGGSAMLNLPIIDDRLAARFVGTYKETDGWIDRVVVDPFPIGPGGACGLGSCTRGNVSSAPVTERYSRTNWERLSGGRGSVRWVANDSLTVDVLGMYQRIEMGAPSQIDIPPGTLTHYQPFDISEPFADTFRLLSLTMTYDFGPAQLTSATSTWSRESTWTGDTSETFQSFLSAYYGFNDLVPVRYSNDDHSKQTSEELRLASSGNAAWQWVVGGFYSTFESVFNQYNGNPVYGQISYGGAAANPDGIGYQASNPYHIKQYAAFAESSYRFDNDLKATLGARWFKYDTNLNFEQSGFFSQTGNASQYTGQVSGSDSGVNPKVNIAYLPSENLTLYVQAAKGFRPGGVNLPVPVPPCTQQAPLSYKPDSLWNYEVGEKAHLLDGRLTVNTDFYYIVWKDVQQLLTPPCAFPNTQNAGTAVSYGPEIEISMRISHDLTFGINGTYTEAHIRDVSAGVAGEVLGATTPLVPGLPLENVPRYSVNASLGYSHALTDAIRLKARLATTTVGPYHDIGYYFESLPGYTVTNARIGFERGPARAFLFGDNLTNKLAITTINNMQWSAPIPSLDRATIVTPRTIGADFTYKF